MTRSEIGTHASIAHATSVLPSVVAAYDTTAIPASSSNGPSARRPAPRTPSRKDVVAGLCSPALAAIAYRNAIDEGASTVAHGIAKGSAAIVPRPGYAPVVAGVAGRGGLQLPDAGHDVARRRPIGLLLAGPLSQGGLKDVQILHGEGTDIGRADLWAHTHPHAELIQLPGHLAGQNLPLTRRHGNVLLGLDDPGLWYKRGKGHSQQEEANDCADTEARAPVRLVCMPSHDVFLLV